MTSAPSSSAALTVFFHSARHAAGSAARVRFENQTGPPNCGAQINAMSNRSDVDIRTPSLGEFVSAALAIISCLAPGQDPAGNSSPNNWREAKWCNDWNARQMSNDLIGRRPIDTTRSHWLWSPTVRKTGGLMHLP